MAAFEYKILQGSETDEEDEEMLNELGAEGWELVNVRVTQVTVSYGESEDEDDEESVEEEYLEEVATFYLKRAKND